MPWLVASNLEQLALGLQAGLVQTRRMPVWVWGWLEAFRFFRWCPDWMLPILNDLVWAWKLVMRIPDLKRAVSGPSAFLGPKMVKFTPNFCYCAVDQERPFLKGNGPFLAHLLFWARNGKIYPEFLLLCCRPRKGRFLKETAVSGPSAPLGPEMIKFGPNFCYCAVYQEKVVFERKRAVSSPSALFGPGRPLGGLLGALGLPSAFKDLQRLPGACRASGGSSNLEKP